MKKILLGLLLLTAACPGLSSAADPVPKPPLPERVNAFCEKYSSVPAILKRHEEWSKQEPENADAWILPANALMKLAETVSISTAPAQKGDFVLKDSETGKTVGSIAGKPDPALLKQAAAILTAASLRFPHRFDILVGRMAMAQRGEDIPEVKAASLALLAAVAKEPAAMRWIDNAPLPGEPVERAIGEVRARIRWLYGLQRKSADQAAYDCAVKALELAPQNAELLNDAAVYHLYRGEWKEGREYLLRAEKATPQDLIIQHNIARASAEIGDKADALARLQAIIKAAPGTDDAKAAADSIKSLKLEEAGKETK